MMIRAVFCLPLILLAFTAVSAADWARYVNPRFGAAVDIPPGFIQEGPARAQGDGRRFKAQNGRSAIEVWGAPASAKGFSHEMSARIAADEAKGWAITYRSETPDWAAWGGTRAGHVFYAKSILTCGDTQTANVRVQYPAADIPEFDTIANRLGRSLSQDGGCF